MIRYQGHKRTLAIGLACLAGFVDALGFQKLSGMFVSFMSGNSTSMAVSLATQGWSGATAAGTLIVTFVGGVIAGALIGRTAGRWRKQVILGFIGAILSLTAAWTLTGTEPIGLTVLMAFAMGAANDVFQRDGEVSIGVTYMTGTLVKLGQNVAASLAGGPPLGWLPYLQLWLGLVAGAVVGAAIYPSLGLRALWIASGFTLLLFAGSIAIGPLPDDPAPSA
jgi:uncharacterized membrane protein YoaK (UPF0700 family)